MQTHRFKSWLNALFEQENNISDSTQTCKFGKPQKLARGGTHKKSRTKAFWLCAFVSLCSCLMVRFCVSFRWEACRLDGQAHEAPPWQERREHRQVRLLSLIHLSFSRGRPVRECSTSYVVSASKNCRCKIYKGYTWEQPPLHKDAIEWKPFPALNCCAAHDFLGDPISQLSFAFKRS